MFSGCQIFLNLVCSHNIRSQNEKFQNSLKSALHCGYASDCGYCILEVHHGKSLVPPFVAISVDPLFDNILHPKICSNPLTCKMRTNICFGGRCVCEHCSVDEVGVTGR